MTFRDDVDVLVVGAGFAGAVMAERCAAAGMSVLVIDERNHIGGNAYDHRDEHGVRVHAYGPHLFHTNAPTVVDYLSRFTAWWPYEHRVLADVDGQLVPMPINRTTLNMLFDAGLADDNAAAEFLRARAQVRSGRIRNSEDAVTSKVGRELYEMFFRGYTRKQWGKDPSQLAASVCARIPIRTDVDDRYFTDTHQALPADGYTSMFERMLDHSRIEVRTSTPYRTVDVRWAHLVWTGPIDQFYDYRFGRLPYRSLRFEWHSDPTPDGCPLQPVATLNYPSESVLFTRTTEFGHLTDERHEVSTRVTEFPSAHGDPYYPVPAEENQALYRRYAQLGAQDGSVTFVGRLATYRYYNMDQVVAQALTTFATLADTLGVTVSEE